MRALVLVLCGRDGSMVAGAIGVYGSAHIRNLMLAEAASSSGTSANVTRGSSSTSPCSSPARPLRKPGLAEPRACVLGRAVARALAGRRGHRDPKFCDSMATGARPRRWRRAGPSNRCQICPATTTAAPRCETSHASRHETASPLRCAGWSTGTGPGGSLIQRRHSTRCSRGCRAFRLACAWPLGSANSRGGGTAPSGHLTPSRASAWSVSRMCRVYLPRTASQSDGVAGASHSGGTARSGPA
jgi:hypothetical protein